MPSDTPERFRAETYLNLSTGLRGWEVYDGNKRIARDIPSERIAKFFVRALRENTYGKRK